MEKNDIQKILLATILICLPSLFAIDANALENKVKEILTHSYLVIMVDGMPVKDKLMNCFLCNQSFAFDNNDKVTEINYYESEKDD